jgi:hypothetical protein
LLARPHQPVEGNFLERLDRGGDVRIRSCSGAIAAFAARVMMVNDSIVSLGGASSKSVSALSRDGGLIQRSHKPAKQNGSPLFNITRNGCRFPSRSCHS